MAKTLGPSDTDAGAKKPRPVKPRAVKPARPKAVPARPMKPKAVPPKAAQPTGQKATPQKAAPQKPKAVPPKAVPPKAVPPKAVPPKPVAPKPVQPKAVAPKPVSPKAVKPAQPKPVPAKPAAPEAAKPKPVPAKPAAPKAAKPAAAKPTAARARSAGARPTAPKPKTAAATPPPPAAEGPRRGVELSQDDPLIGRTIGRCRIEELVGVGKTAKVYRAHYEALDDDVAVKILRKEIAENPVLVSRFQSEALAIAKVDNENVLKIYDVGREDGLYYMVVEFLDGEEVFEVIRREGQVEPMDALRIVRQAANGLGAAHALNLVHRDIKPQNLFLLEDGTVKVVDFGLATGFDEGSERVGTPHYMAPEVCEDGTAEFASDIYGLGIVLYHLLVGQPPYSGKDIRGILRAHMDGKPLRPRQQRPGLPKEMTDIVQHLTKRDPLMRPTAPELVAELDEIGGKELKEKDTLKKRTHSSRARSAVARRARRGNKSLAPILIGTAVVIVALFFLLKGDDKPSRSGKSSRTKEGGSTLLTDDGKGAKKAVYVETEAEKKAKFERVFKAEREEKSKEAFKNAEAYARRIWREPKDTAAVLSKYGSVINSYKDTTGAKAAKFRVDQIKKKELHPHPDRELTTASRLQAVKADWKTNQPKVLDAIARFDYTAAADLVPPPVSDETGSFQRELDFWREHTKHLLDFRAALVKEIRDMPREDRIVQTPEGEGTIINITDKEFEVEVGRNMLKFDWPDMGATAIADLGLDAFSEKDARLMLLQLAFTFAHRLNDGFWDAKMTLETTPGASAWSRQSKEYKRRFK